MSAGAANANGWPATLMAVAVAVAIPACRAGDDPPRLTGTRDWSLSQASPSAQQAKLLASDGTDFDSFGSAVALSGDIAVVGASRNDQRGPDAGAAYVFARSGASWTQQAKLTAADGAGNENFGISVAVAVDTAVVGAIFASDAGSSAFGAVYVFVRSGASWIQQAKLIPPDGVADDQFGTSVALAGDTAVVGAVNAGGSTAQAGAAYVFVRSGASWTQQAKLTAADGAALDHFGTSMALSGDTALIGASGSDDPEQNAGAAYVFVRSGASWIQQAKLTAADGAGGNAFGAAVALVDDTALIGSPFDSERGAASGSTYVFVRSGASWALDTKLAASDGGSIDFLGVSVALSGSSAVVGAPGRADLGRSSGAAYVFVPATTRNGDACATGAECVSGSCVDGVCCNTACGGGDPGDCQACSVAAGAAVDGTCAPRAAGAVCRGAAGACDVAETCTGTSPACPADAFVTAGTVCQPAAGACDVAEACTGSSAACPTDQFVAAGTVCRSSTGGCDFTETCTGSSATCPADRLAPAGAICRGAAGACDLAETCTGTSAACPADQLTPAGAVCRPAAGSCDLVESCTGTAGACPANRFKPDLSLCTGGLLGLPGICLAGQCIL